MATKQRGRSIAAMLAIALASVASVATSQAPPNATADASVTVAVEADEIPTRWIDVSVAPGAQVPAYLDLFVSAEYPFLISVFDSQAGTRQPPDPKYSEIALVNLRPACGQGCQRTFLLVVRSAEPATGIIEARVSAFFADSEPRDVGVSIRPEADARFVSSPATLTSTLVGSIEVAAGARPTKWKGRLVASAEALPQDATWTLGSLWPSGDLSGISESLVTLTVRVGRNDAGYSLFDPGEFSGFGTDWGSQCAPSAPCELPVEVELDWFISPEETPPPGGVAKVTFTLEARLEYLERSEVPAGATIELLADE